MNVVDRIDDERRTLLMVLMKKVMVVEKDSLLQECQRDTIYAVPKA
jgi:hypothetical protein